MITSICFVWIRLFSWTSSAPGSSVDPNSLNTSLSKENWNIQIYNLGVNDKQICQYCVLRPLAECSESQRSGDIFHACCSCLSTIQTIDCIRASLSKSYQTWANWNTHERRTSWKVVCRRDLVSIVLSLYAGPGMAKAALYLLNQVIVEKMGSTMGFLYQDLH